jgi:hypothetical protein
VCAESADDREPPRQIWYSLDEALVLLADLEDARGALIATGYLAGAVAIEHELRLLSRKLDLDAPEDDDDGR